MYLPAQDLPKDRIDFRGLTTTNPRGFKVGPSSTANTTSTQPAVKRKRADEDENAFNASSATYMDVDVRSSKRVCVQISDHGMRNIVGVFANKAWKLPASQRASARSSRSSGKSWDQKETERQRRQVNKDHALAARQAYKEAEKKRHSEVRAAKERKEEKRKENDRRHGQIVSSATARRMMKSKKLRKQLVVA